MVIPGVSYIETLTSQPNFENAARGLLALTITAGISLCSVIAVFINIIVTGCRTKHEFIRSPVGPFFVSLLLCDISQAIGSIMSLKWVIIQDIQDGSFCTAQAGLKQTGNVGTALWSMTIAMYTFSLLFLRRPMPRRLTLVILTAVWLFQGFIIMMGPAILEKALGKGPFFGISGYWCWIKSAYRTEQLTNEYLYMFLALLVGFILYPLIFLRLRGNIRGYNWDLRLCKAEHPWKEEDFGNSEISCVGKQMLWYPIAYTIIVVPIAICRWSDIFGHTVPYWAIILADSIFMLSGFVNAILYTTTTRKLISIPAPAALSRLLRNDKGGFNSKTSLPNMDFSPSLPNMDWEEFQRRRSMLIQNHEQPRRASEFPEGLREHILEASPTVLQHNGTEIALNSPPRVPAPIYQPDYSTRENCFSIIHPFADPNAYVSPRRSPIQAPTALSTAPPRPSALQPAPQPEPGISCYPVDSDTTPPPRPKHKRFSSLGFPDFNTGKDQSYESSGTSFSNGGGSAVVGSGSSDWSDLEDMRFASPSPEQLRKAQTSALGVLELFGYDARPSAARWI